MISLKAGQMFYPGFKSGFCGASNRQILNRLVSVQRKCFCQEYWRSVLRSWGVFLLLLLLCHPSRDPLGIPSSVEFRSRRGKISSGLSGDDSCPPARRSHPCWRLPEEKSEQKLRRRERIPQKS